MAMQSIVSRLRGAAGTGVRRVRAQVHQATGRSARERAALGGDRGVILMYHRVLPRAQAQAERVESGMFVDPDTFGRHLEWLAAHFSVLPLSEMALRLATGQSLPKGACAITFDDGWTDNWVHAAPHLSRLGLPATLFAVSDRVGTDGGFWPDETERRLTGASAGVRAQLAQAIGMRSASEPADFLEFLKGIREADRPALIDQIRAQTTDPLGSQRPLMNWDELDQLAEIGVEIEVHGASHAILTGLDPAGVRDELSRSLAHLRERGHAKHGLLAYPSGAYDAGVVEIARELGYRAAVTTEPGLASASIDPLLLPRVGIHDDISRTQAEFLRFVPGAH